MIRLPRICLLTTPGLKTDALQTKFGFRISKYLFSKVVKGEASISCVKNRHFKRSESINNFFQLGVPPLTFFKKKKPNISDFLTIN